MREELTILVVPRVNPDGDARFWRENFDPVLEPGDPTDFWTAGRGYDINRWHMPTRRRRTIPCPRQRPSSASTQRFQPAIVVDYHHQGSYVNEDGELIRTSMFWPRPKGGAGSTRSTARSR